MVIVEDRTSGEGKLYTGLIPKIRTHLDGRSVHNVRIERLWVDVTAQIGSLWHDQFTNLELHHGLNVHNRHHLWLLQYLFLDAINDQLQEFMQAWNNHRIQIRHGPNRSPIDMFGFDMLVHGHRGDELVLSHAELEVFGVDWEALRDARLRETHRNNNHPDEPSTSWIGREGPPDHLNEVNVDPAPVPHDLDRLSDLLVAWLATQPQTPPISVLWFRALGLCRDIWPDIF